MWIRAQTATLRSDQADSVKATVAINDWKITENLDGVKTLIYEEHDEDRPPKIFSTDEAGLYDRLPKWLDP